MEHRLHSIVRRAVGDSRSDAELLARIRDDEGAFAELVARHGPMVWGVCRHMLGEADAEDAFQATFLVVLRSNLRNAAALAAWLHGVAVRVSLTARRQAARRRYRERTAAALEAVLSPRTDDWADTMAVVHREVAALPARDRSAFVLCVLEGLTQAETAARLGRTPGVVAGQVARAKKRLVARLTRRGIAPALSGLGAATVAGGIPSAVVGRAIGLTTGNAASAVIRLAKGASTMTTVRTKIILAAAVVTIGLATGILAATGGHQIDPPPAVGAKPPPPATEPTAKAPAQQMPKPVHSLTGHINRVTAVAFSPDGASIATASWDGSARIWDVKTGKEVLRLGLNDKQLQPGEPEANTFHQIAFSPDNALVLTMKRGTRDRFDAIVWSRRTGEQVRTFPAEGGSFAVSPDGTLIACGGYKVIRLYELGTGKPVREISGDEKQLRIESLTFSPDGNTLISTGHPPTPQKGDGVTRLTIQPDVMQFWDVATGKERHSALNGRVVGMLGQHIALSPDGRTVVHANMRDFEHRHDIRVLEVATGGLRARLTGHKDDIRDYVFSPDGRTVASGSMDGMVRLWDVLTGKEIGRFGIEVTDASKGGWVESVAFSPDGRTLISGGLDKNAYLWDVSRITGRQQVVIERSPTELDADWKDLAGDAAKSYAAIGRLVSSPGTAVPFLGKHLEAAAATDTKPVEQLIKSLDDEKFEVRERATKELAAMGDRAAPSLRKALAGTPSAEARQRVSGLLALVDAAGPSSETLREMRAIETLELIGSLEARRLLEKLAAGPAEMPLTQDAKASAERLTKRRPG